MKICLLGDTHFGARNDKQNFHDYFERFYENIFFPYLIKNKITRVIQLGDLFDRRKYINFNTLYRSRKYFFDRFEELGFQLDVFLGNHDTSFKNTNEVNSPSLLLGEYSHISVYEEPTDIEIDGLKITLLPWLCAENYTQCIDHIENTDAKVLLGHLELAGFEMHRGHINEHGQFKQDMLDKFNLVCSGHFHHKSTLGNIHYLGTPYEMDWNDYNDPKGFHILDTSTLELEYIKNPYLMFQKWYYDDTCWDSFEEMNTLPFSNAENAIIKVIVKNKNNPYWFDQYIKRLEQANATDIMVVEDHLNLNLDSDDTIIDEAEDTITILKKVIENVDSKQVSHRELEKFLVNLYSEALHVE